MGSIAEGQSFSLVFVCSHISGPILLVSVFLEQNELLISPSSHVVLPYSLSLK